MNLYFVRHGESMGNRSGKIQGCMDFPLSDLGIEQAEAVARRFSKMKLNAIYSSDLTRAYDTAKTIASASKLQVEKWTSVREVYLGPLQGLTREQIYEMYPEAKLNSILTSGIKDTETNEQLTERCRYVIEELVRKHRDENVAIVSHGGFISIFLMYILAGDKWHTLQRPFQIGNTSVTCIEWKEEKPIIHYVNDTQHLQIHTDRQQLKSLL